MAQIGRLGLHGHGRPHSGTFAGKPTAGGFGGPHDPGNIGRVGLHGHGRPNFGVLGDKPASGSGGSPGGPHNPGNIGRIGMSGHGRPNSGVFAAKPSFTPSARNVSDITANGTMGYAGQIYGDFTTRFGIFQRARRLVSAGSRAGRIGVGP